MSCWGQLITACELKNINIFTPTEWNWYKLSLATLFLIPPAHKMPLAGSYNSVSTLQENNNSE